MPNAAISSLQGMFFLLKSEKYGVFDDANFPSFISYARVKICEFSSGGDRDGAQTSLRLNHQGKAEPFLCPLFLSESFSLYRLSIGHYLFFGCKGTADGMHQVPINLFSKNFSAAFRNQRWRFSINFLQNSLAFIPLLRSSASHRKKRQKRPTDRIKKTLRRAGKDEFKQKAPSSLWLE